MNIYQLIDFAHQHRSQLTESLRCQIVDDIKESDLIKISEFFISNLEKKHQVPGDVIITIAGVIDWYREKQFITIRQKSHLVNSLIDYWNNLSLMSFSSLNI